MVNNSAMLESEQLAGLIQAVQSQLAEQCRSVASAIKQVSLSLARVDNSSQTLVEIMESLDAVENKMQILITEAFSHWLSNNRVMDGMPLHESNPLDNVVAIVVSRSLSASCLSFPNLKGFDANPHPPASFEQPQPSVERWDLLAQEQKADADFRQKLFECLEEIPSKTLDPNIPHCHRTSQRSNQI